jgi:hypothetical protein
MDRRNKDVCNAKSGEGKKNMLIGKRKKTMSRRVMWK